MCLKTTKREIIKKYANYKFRSLCLANYDFKNSHSLIKKIGSLLLLKTLARSVSLSLAAFAPK